jgi:copper chaperone CopZ
MKLVTLTSTVVIAVLALALWSFWPAAQGGAAPALADLRIDKLTCGSCVEKIQQALHGAPGVGAIDISVTAGRGRIEFDPDRIGAEAIVSRISTAGYPSRIEEILSSAEYLALQNEEQGLAEKYVARVGRRLLSRADFESRLSVSGGDRAALWQELLPRELLLNAAESAKVVIQDGEVENRLSALRAAHPDFEQLTAGRFGSPEQLSRQIKEEMTMARHLEKNVLPAELPAAERAAFLNRWYAELTAGTVVTVFDPQLQIKTRATGCGGACCGPKPGA